MIKKINLLVFLLLCGFVYNQTKQIVEFEWHHDTLDGEFFEKTSMHIPVVFHGDSTTYYFQFDTGANKSYFYTGGNVDSVFCNWITNKEGVETSIGKLNLLKRNSNEVYSKNGNLYIGTIGSDFLKDKKIEIDFKKQTITFLESIDPEKYSLTSIKLSYGRPVFQLSSHGKSYDFLFDTGSSLFELWTTKKIWRKLKKKDAVIDRYPISSWGEINIAYRANLKENVLLSICSNVVVKTVWYNSNKRHFKKVFREAGTDGIIGNKPFLDQIILIDVANKTVGIKKCIEQDLKINNFKN